MAARRRGPPPSMADAAAVPHGAADPQQQQQQQQQPSTSGRPAAAGHKSSGGSSKAKVPKARRPAAASGKLQPLTISTPLLVLLLALLAAIAVKQWPPDGLLRSLMGSGGGSSSDDGSSGDSSSSGGMPGGREEGGLIVADARGFFPKGCKWREVQEKGEDPGMWGLRRYQYWDAAARNWTEQQPAACVVPGVDPSQQKWRWRNGSPRSAADCNDNYCLYENLWFNNGRFYLLVDGEEGIEPWKLTRNQELNIMHVKDARQFVASTPHRVVPGDTLVFDFVFFLHPTAIGHWSEMLFPLFSILRQERSFSRPPTQFLQLHLKRCHMMEWVRANLATALGVGPKQDLPPIMFQTEVADVGDQMAAPLEGIPPDTWVALDRVLVVKDIFTGGVRTFLDRRDAHLYRKMLYAQYGLPTPRKRSPLPRVITFQRKRANRRVVNEPELLKMLREFGEVRVVEFNASTPFKTQLEVMASTGVLVSVHTSNLANAQFMQPGSAVFEIIQRNWFWHGLDRSFQVQTDMMGDIHHYAWRATGANETRYIEPRDEARFGDWEPLQCNTEECVEAHTNVDVIVDIPAFRALLADRLPLVFAGWPVEAAALPWPEQEGAAEAEAEDLEGEL